MPRFPHPLPLPLNFSRQRLSSALACMSMLLLTACATGPKTYEIRGEASNSMNRDVSGRSLSVAVKVYQLKEAAEFSKLTFDMLASGRSEAEMLGDDLLAQNEIIMVPGHDYANTAKLQENTKYVGVVALFRQPDPHYWRFLVEADAIRSKGLSFRIEDCYLKVVTPAPAPIPGQPQQMQPACKPEVRAEMAATTRPAAPTKR